MSYAPDTLARPDRWRDEAACLSQPDLFVPRRTEKDGRVTDARRVCATCPVRQDCLTSAMAEEGRSDQFRRAGVRGGLTPTQRASLARRSRQ